ncbi:MAG: hypothetical protein ACREOZ_00375 [Gloeomargaritales cyanobacterium]
MSTRRWSTAYERRRASESIGFAIDLARVGELFERGRSSSSSSSSSESSDSSDSNSSSCSNHDGHGGNGFRVSSSSSSSSHGGGSSHSSRSSRATHGSGGSYSSRVSSSSQSSRSVLRRPSHQSSSDSSSVIMMSSSSSSSSSTVDDDDALFNDYLAHVLLKTNAQVEAILRPISDPTIVWGQRVRIAELSEAGALDNFRFRTDHLLIIADALWPLIRNQVNGTRDKMQIGNRYTAPYETCLLLFLSRLSRPRRIRMDMETIFGMRKSHISRAVIFMVNCL